MTMKVNEMHLIVSIELGWVSREEGKKAFNFI